jgi:myo-inositol-1(or 4)-monophosphatase
MRYQELVKEVISAARRAGDFIAGERGKLSQDNIETKGLHDHVTYVDKTAEQMLVDMLGEILPQAGFIVEEGTSTKVGESYQWIVDPLDGTSNFIHDFGPFAVSIALMDSHKQIVVGVVHEVTTGETYYAWQGSSAYCNDRVITVSGTETLTDAMIGTGFPYNEYSRLDAHVQALAHFLRVGRGIRRLGSAATDICYVACGRFDAFWEYNLSPWDCAAATLILQQAGGHVADFSGGDNYIFGKQLMAANKHLAKEFFQTVSGYFA